MSTIKVDTVQSSGGGAVTLTSLFPPKAHVTFDGTTPQIDNSDNVSSFVDDAVGAYTISFSNSFDNANYCLVMGCGDGLVSTSAEQFPVIFTGSHATGSVQISSRQCDNDAPTFAQADHSRISAALIP